MQIFRLLSITAFVSSAVLAAFMPQREAQASEISWQPQIVAMIAASAPSAMLPAMPPSSTPISTPKHQEFSPRELLASLANRLRDIRYTRGGRDPSTGFDCSGFVRYVFRHGLGAELPASSAAQFGTGHKINRADLRSGDLVFFRIGGKRISHVGIYLEDGKFIHAPSAGKSVSVSSLREPYWAKHYAGAKRPEILAAADSGMLAQRS
jgi:cell wall-associated NlpC family hydrolase